MFSLGKSADELQDLRAEIRGETTARQLRIASGIASIRERMPHAMFMAWYMTTSLDEAELERQIGAKLAQLDGGA